MKKSVRLLQLILLAGSVFLLLGSVTYAWFSKVNQTNVITIDSASLKVEVDLYEAGHSLTSPDNTDYNLVTESITFGRVIPGEVYHFKLVIRNTGSIPGNITVNINELDLEHSIGLPEDLFIFNILGTRQSISIDNDNLLFDNVEVDHGEEIELLFAIEVSGDASSDVTAEYLRIKHINVRLDQIQVQEP